MDDPPPPRWPQRQGRPARPRLHPLAAGILLSLALISPPPSRAGLFKPVLQLMRPQLEQRLSRLCLSLSADGNPNLENALRRPCQKLAVPASHCLVEETDASGREMAVIAEILGGKVGAASEEVLKRCAARLLSLPPDSFQAVPLSELGKRLRAAKRGGSAPAAPLPPADAAR